MGKKTLVVITDVDDEFEFTDVGISQSDVRLTVRRNRAEIAQFEKRHLKGWYFMEALAWRTRGETRIQPSVLICPCRCKQEPRHYHVENWSVPAGETWGESYTEGTMRSFTDISKSAERPNGLSLATHANQVREAIRSSWGQASFNQTAQ